MRIIGTIAGAEIAVLIVHGSYIVFCLYSLFFAVRYVNYALSTFFLTLFVLVLLLLIPGQIFLAQTKVLDTIIGVGSHIHRMKSEHSQPDIAEKDALLALQRVAESVALAQEQLHSDKPRKSKSITFRLDSNTLDELQREADQNQIHKDT